jgi:hypothetical protein
VPFAVMCAGNRDAVAAMARVRSVRSQKSQHKHELFDRVDPYGPMGFSCNLCTKSYSRETSYHCPLCRYDECSSCHSMPTNH